MRPLLLVILDGWGMGPKTKANPFLEARLPSFEHIAKTYPWTLLQASGISAGLLWGEAGNSESGHLTLGAGRTIYQYLPRIILAIRSGAFFKNPAFLNAIKHVRTNSSRLHVMGLVSSGAVHSYIDCLWALIDFAKQNNLSPDQLIIHMFSDGRDSPVKEGKKMAVAIEEHLHKAGIGTIGSIIGRHFAMDRDGNWDRTQRAYSLLTEGKGAPFQDPTLYLQASYANNITDEFMEPGIRDPQGSPPLTIQNGDAVIFFDYREDSVRQLTKAFVQDEFTDFPRKKVENLYFCTMTEYQKDLPHVFVAFPLPKIIRPLGKVLSESGVHQFRIAETEKYAHITFFFNGLHEKPFEGEERILVKSEDVAHFDLAPEMRASDITKTLLEKLETDSYQFLLANFANADLVGHTGNVEASIKAAETLDREIGILKDAVLKKDGHMLITADHGNIEEKMNLMTGETLTEHSQNPVPFYLIGNEFAYVPPREGKDLLFLPHEAHAPGVLADVAPTVLELLDIKKPPEMTGRSLLRILVN